LEVREAVILFLKLVFTIYLSSEEIGKLRQKLQSPKTVIAVVGDTGAGKSSLMNAVLDHAAILPTSGMRACTAVVVEISESTSGLFEADIEFLSEGVCWCAFCVML
jgi:predicted GTPase